VTFLPDPTSSDAPTIVKRLPRGGVAVAENTRFYPGEEKNDSALAEQLAALGDLYVNDAFGSAHRAHASTEAVARILKPAVSGFLLERELRYLGQALHQPKRPFVAVLGGAKISGKIDLIEALLPKVDQILLGGAMACTFFKAMDLETGTSLVEADRVDLARDLMKKAGAKLVLPEGGVIARELAPNVETRTVKRDAIPQGWAVYDIDPDTEKRFARSIEQAGTVVWNGPMGVFETPPFDHGTLAIARAMAKATDNGAVTVIGGGDSAAAVAQAKLSDRITHVSTGGGASLEFLEGKELPGVAALDEA
jgi:phosphoglycerate kinase